MWAERLRPMLIYGTPAFWRSAKPAGKLPSWLPSRCLNSYRAFSIAFSKGSVLVAGRRNFREWSLREQERTINRYLHFYSGILNEHWIIRYLCKTIRQFWHDMSGRWKRTIATCKFASVFINSVTRKCRDSYACRLIDRNGKSYRYMRSADPPRFAKNNVIERRKSRDQVF